MTSEGVLGVVGGIRMSIGMAIPLCGVSLVPALIIAYSSGEVITAHHLEPLGGHDRKSSPVLVTL